MKIFVYVVFSFALFGVGFKLQNYTLSLMKYLLTDEAETIYTSLSEPLSFGFISGMFWGAMFYLSAFLKADWRWRYLLAPFFAINSLTVICLADAIWLKLNGDFLVEASKYESLLWKSFWVTHVIVGVIYLRGKSKEGSRHSFEVAG